MCRHTHSFEIETCIHWCPACGAFREVDAIFGEPVGDWVRPGKAGAASRNRHIRRRIKDKEQAGHNSLSLSDGGK